MGVEASFTTYAAKFCHVCRWPARELQFFHCLRLRVRREYACRLRRRGPGRLGWAHPSEDSWQGPETFFGVRNPKRGGAVFAGIAWSRQVRPSFSHCRRCCPGTTVLMATATALTAGRTRLCCEGTRACAKLMSTIATKRTLCLRGFALRCRPCRRFRPRVFGQAFHSAGGSWRHGSGIWGCYKS